MIDTVLAPAKIESQFDTPFCRDYKASPVEFQPDGVDKQGVTRYVESNGDPKQQSDFGKIKEPWQLK